MNYYPAKDEFAQLSFLPRYFSYYQLSEVRVLYTKFDSRAEREFHEFLARLALKNQDLPDI
jgi:hypothetical protein